jgi:hypothetical protein
MEMLIAFVLAGALLAAVVWWWERRRRKPKRITVCDRYGNTYRTTVPVVFEPGQTEATVTTECGNEVRFFREVTLAPGVSDQPRGEG